MRGVPARAKLLTSNGHVSRGQSLDVRGTRLAGLVVHSSHGVTPQTSLPPRGRETPQSIVQDRGRSANSRTGIANPAPPGLSAQAGLLESRADVGRRPGSDTRSGGRMGTQAVALSIKQP